MSRTFAVAGFFLAISIFTFTFAMTDAEFQAYIAQINAAAVSHQKVTPNTVSRSKSTGGYPTHKNRTLSRGMRGSDVLALQQSLIARGLLSAGYATGYFGALTEAAVKVFQSNTGIVSSGTPATTGYGAVGLKTRAAIANEKTSFVNSQTGSSNDQRGSNQPSAPIFSPSFSAGGGDGNANNGSSGATSGSPIGGGSGSPVPTVVSSPAFSASPISGTSPLVGGLPSDIPTDQTAVRLKAIGIKSVTDFGAIGDGVTDDTDAFNRALSSPGNIYVPGAKTYRLTKPITAQYSSTLFSDGSATLKFEGSANIRIPAPFVRLSGFRIDAQSQSSSACIFTIDTGTPPPAGDIDAKLRIENMTVNGSPCFYNETGQRNYFDVDFRNITITNAHGTQFEFDHDFAYMQLSDVSIAEVAGLTVPLIHINNDQGAWISNLSFSGSSASTNNHGLSIENSVALWLIGIRARGLGGSGIYGRHVDALYIRNLSVDGGASCVDINDGDRSLGSSLSGSSCSTSGIKLSNVRRSVITPVANSVPAEPGDLVAMRGFDVYRSLLNDNYVSVADYGAKGDGVTDDSAAFSRAVASGKNVYVPWAPAYALKNTITLDRPVAIVAPQPVFITSTARTVFLIKSSGVTIDGFRSDIRTTNLGAVAIGIDQSSGQLSNLSLQDLYLQGFSHILDNGSVPISHLDIQSVISYTPTDASFRLNNAQDSVLWRVTASNTGADKPASFPGIVLQQPSNVLVRESTVGGFGEGGTIPASPPNPSSGGLSVKGGQNVFLSQFHADTTNGHGVTIDGSNGVYGHELISGYNALSNITVTNGAKNVSGVNSLIYERIPPLPVDPSSVGVRVLQGSTVNFSNIVIVDHATPYATDSTVVATFNNNQLNAAPGVPPPPPPPSPPAPFTWHHLGASSASYSVVGVGDFNHSGSSELMFRNNSTGDMGYYQFTNDVIAWHAIGGSSPAYTVVGVGDFNKSGTSEVMFEGTGGDLGYYQINANDSFTWHHLGGTATTTYAVVSIGDFNGDGASDILFRDPTGDIGYDAVNADGAIPTWHHIGSSSPNYSVIGVGNFDGASAYEIMFRNNATGDMGYYQVNNDAITWHAIGGSSPSYSVVGIGDFNKSGTSEIMFRDSTGDMGYDSVSGNATVWHHIGGSSPTYSTVGVGDFNKDAASDVMFRGPEGDLGYYQINN